ncbi:MAG: hypothetical protein IPN76_31260 [Saprospiraceae bacterium]|nr:hypothetical protein [Saprospiraceae bacterium]
MEDGNLTTLTDILYQNVDIYENNVTMLGLQFISPSARLPMPSTAFYILDTLQYKGMEVVDLAFMPVNKQDIGFKGSLYILNDTSYAVVKADLGISEKINLNFVQDLQLVQEFAPESGAWILTKDQLVADIALTKGSTGFFKTRSVLYRNHRFDLERSHPFTAARKTYGRKKALINGTTNFGRLPGKKNSPNTRRASIR